jgi:ribonuclease HI
MSKMNWKRAKKVESSISLKGDRDFSERDPAAAWLSGYEAGLREKNCRPEDRKGPRRKQVNPTLELESRHEYVIYTDGACQPNPGVGGWGYVVYKRGEEVHSDHGGVKRSTNNVMELTALLEAIKWASVNARGALIYTDSTYAERGCNSWRFGWRKNDWRKSGKGGGQPVKNKELWQDIDLALQGAGVIVSWCKGHSGIIGNERADKLSVSGRRAATRGISGSKA